LSLKITKNRKNLIEEIRRKTPDLEKYNWHIGFTWINAHACYGGNELADKMPMRPSKTAKYAIAKSRKAK